MSSLTYTSDAAIADVAFVHWPREAARREECRRAGVPVLLLVEPGGAPPLDSWEYEDWVRTTADSVEVRARVVGLSLRAPVAPVLDEYGLLRVGQRWVGLSATDERLVRVLLDRFGDVVENGELARAGWDEPPGVTTLRVRLQRLRRAIEPLGLTVRNVRGQGYVLGPDAHRGAA